MAFPMTEYPQGVIFVGTFAQCKSLQQLDICDRGAIGVDKHGKIKFVERQVDDVAAIASKYGWEDAEINTASDVQFFVPGFIGELARC